MAPFPGQALGCFPSSLLASSLNCGPWCSERNPPACMPHCRGQAKEPTAKCTPPETTIHWGFGVQLPPSPLAPGLASSFSLFVEMPLAAEL